MIGLVSLMFAGSLFSQDYQQQSSIEKVNKKGFYKIDLQPEIISQLNANFSDIRIKDEHNREVPYYSEKETFEVTKRVFKEYQIKEKIHWENGATVLVIENKAQRKINNIQLQIKNFDVRKHLELAGSDDNEHWYTIKENYLFRSANGLNTTSEVKSLNFPYLDYKYYRIVIYDVFSLPINVLKVGYYDTYKELGRFKQLERPTITSWDSVKTKETYVKIDFKSRPYFDKFTIGVSHPNYFHRSARICLKREDKKGRVYYDVIKYLTISSNDDLTFYEDEFPHQTFYLVINNEDNPPLEGITFEAYQLNRYLIAYLEKGNNYSLVFDNAEVHQHPNYDIDYFKNKIGGDLNVLSAGKIKERIPIEIKKEEESSELWIWGAIGLVALLLGFVSYKMINEMEKKK